MDSQDEIVGILPIHYSNGHTSNVQIHQFPLLTRPLQAPPSAILSGKSITARIKSDVHRLEVHVPADSRPEVWNVDRTKVLGAARAEDDREKNQDLRVKGREVEEPRLSEIRLRSEEIPQRGVHMLGIVRNGTTDCSPGLTTNCRLRQTSSSPD
jgi:DNA-directed RNA polymerase-3 subunit RPC5